MRIFIKPKYVDEIINVPIKTSAPQRICVKVYHTSKPNTVYFESDPVINGSIVFNIRVPKSPKEGLFVEIYNEKNGHLQGDNSFMMGNVTVTPLLINVPAKGIADVNTRNFALFCDDFSEDAGVLPSQNDSYVSPNNKFRIDYVTVIRDDDGNELTTPARVNKYTKRIEVSKKYFSTFTVPGRKAILWHEFSHVYLNLRPEDEFEADKNAIFMYLGTGNPKLEAFIVFLKTFQNAPHDGNVQRAEKLENYIRNFNYKTLN